MSIRHFPACSDGYYDDDSGHSHYKSKLKEDANPGNTKDETKP